MTVLFNNNSELPIECISTFGVSVKENEHPIGYFGTGLKYAVAVLLREGCDVTMYIGGKEYAFSKRQGEIRGKQFEFIDMNGQPLPFTTELGKNWQLWQAYRELYSNCMDEKGFVVGEEYEYQPDARCRDSGTSIKVDGEAFDEIHAKRGEFILLSEPKHVMGEVEVHESEEPGIFYKGIRVLTMPTRYSYNITSDLTLTEDRTASQWDVEFAITGALTTCNNINAIADILSIDEEAGYHEPKLNYSKYVRPSEEFMKLIAQLKKKPHNASTYYSHWEPNFVGALPKSALPRAIQKKLKALQDLFSYNPKNVHVILLNNEDYKIVKEDVCLNISLFSRNNAKKLTFVYILACLSAKKPGKSAYSIITEDMLKYFNLPKGVKINAETGKREHESEAA